MSRYLIVRVKREAALRLQVMGVHIEQSTNPCNDIALHAWVWERFRLEVNSITRAVVGKKRIATDYIEQAHGSQ